MAKARAFYFMLISITWSVLAIPPTAAREPIRIRREFYCNRIERCFTGYLVESYQQQLNWSWLRCGWSEPFEMIYCFRCEESWNGSGLTWWRRSERTIWLGTVGKFKTVFRWNHCVSQHWNHVLSLDERDSLRIQMPCNWRPALDNSVISERYVYEPLNKTPFNSIRVQIQCQIVICRFIAFIICFRSHKYWLII